MHPFPPPEQLEFLRGLEIAIATIGPYQVTFVFDGGTSINIEHAFEFVDASGQPYRYEVQQVMPALHFHDLIRDQEAITHVERADWALTLVFASGRRLVIFSDDGPYEAGNIGSHHGLIVF